MDEALGPISRREVSANLERDRRGRCDAEILPACLRSCYSSSFGVYPSAGMPRDARSFSVIPTTVVVDVCALQTPFSIIKKLLVPKIVSARSTVTPVHEAHPSESHPDGASSEDRGPQGQCQGWRQPQNPHGFRDVLGG